MRLYPCPVCGQEPVVVEDAGGVMAMCWCSARIAQDAKALRHAWNDLYCSNDPATAADCMEGDRCPGATGAGGATPPSSATSSCRGCTRSSAPTAPGGPARR